MLKQKYKINRLLMPALALAFLFSFSFNGKAFSVQNSVVSYSGSSTIVPGMIVSLEPGSATTVEPLSVQNINNMLGVVIVPSQAAASTSASKSGLKQIYVASSGQYNVLVSDQNGAINTGDPLSISSFAGIGMKASQNQTKVIGKALGSFNSKSPTIGSAELATFMRFTNISIGSIPVNVAIDVNLSQSSMSKMVPSSLANTAASIAGKPVGASKIYASLFILLVALILGGTLLYKGIRKGAQSLGAHLSKRAAIRSLVATDITGLLVFAAAVSGVYLILKL